MVEKQTQYITIAFTIVIIIAIAVFIYTSLPQNISDQRNTREKGNQGNTSIPSDSIYLTITYNDTETSYTFDELQKFETITGYGGKRTNVPSIKNQGVYTGVAVTSFVEEITGLTSEYSLRITANEKGNLENQTYNYSVIQGKISIYNANNASEIIDIGGVTMILCYQVDGQLLDESEDGRLMVAFINIEEEKITSAFYWWKFVESIEIITK